MSKLIVENVGISILDGEFQDYISLTTKEVEVDYLKSLKSHEYSKEIKPFLTSYIIKNDNDETFVDKIIKNIKYYSGNTDTKWEFIKQDTFETDNYIYDYIELKPNDTNDDDAYLIIYDDGEVHYNKFGRGTGTSKGTWEWKDNKPVIKFKDISKNASGYVQPTDTDWSAVTEDNKVIGLNAKGPLVKQVQNVLISIGYSGNTGSPITTDVQGCLDNVEKCDGIYGKSTKEMVREYQKDNGLAVDGVVGQQTYDSLI
jgi:hypothetical protein